MVGAWPKRFINDGEGNLIEINPKGNLDNNTPQRELRERIAYLEKDLGNVLNILHFLITDKTMPIPEKLRSSLWPMMDVLIKEQNSR